jgi:hypothetical protein
MLSVAERRYNNQCTCLHACTCVLRSRWHRDTYMYIHLIHACTATHDKSGVPSISGYHSILQVSNDDATRYTRLMSYQNKKPQTPWCYSAPATPPKKASSRPSSFANELEPVDSRYQKPSGAYIYKKYSPAPLRPAGTARL